MATSEVQVGYKADPSGKTMKAAVWTGNFKVEVQDKPKPIITNKVFQHASKVANASKAPCTFSTELRLQHDALLRVTSTAICGSDLHLYGGYMPGRPGHPHLDFKRA